MSTVVSPTRSLPPEHLELAEESGTRPRCIRERGYYTEVSESELARRVSEWPNLLGHIRSFIMALAAAASIEVRAHAR